MLRLHAGPVLPIANRFRSYAKSLVGRRVLCVVSIITLRGQCTTTCLSALVNPVDPSSVPKKQPLSVTGTSEHTMALSPLCPCSKPYLQHIVFGSRLYIWSSSLFYCLRLLPHNAVVGRMHGLKSGFECVAASSDTHHRINGRPTCSRDAHSAKTSRYYQQAHCRSK
jgi:hypothetical protein